MNAAQFAGTSPCVSAAGQGATRPLALPGNLASTLPPSRVAWLSGRSVSVSAPTGLIRGATPHRAAARVEHGVPAQPPCSPGEIAVGVRIDALRGPRWIPDRGARGGVS